jgi:hypothetical protein
MACPDLSLVDQLSCVLLTSDNLSSNKSACGDLPHEQFEHFVFIIGRQHGV